MTPLATLRAQPLGSPAPGAIETAAQRRWRRELIGLTDDQIIALEQHDRAFRREEDARQDAMFGPAQPTPEIWKPIPRGRDAERARRLERGRNV